MKVLIVGHHEVANLLPIAECIEAMAQTFEALGRGEAIQPLRQVISRPDGEGFLAAMPSYLGSPAAVGAKVITIVPGNRETPFESHQGAILLFEPEHGRLLALIEASAVTAIRTAAVSGLATRLLAGPEAGDLALLGSGVQAAVHLEAMRAVRPIRRVRVWGRSLERARSFAAAQSARHGLPVEAVGTAAEAVAGAEIICTVTGSATPVLEGEWLTPGVHINAVGASVKSSRELDSTAVARSRLFVDRMESALNESGDVLIPMAEGAFGREHVRGELADVVLGRVAGRTGANEVTLFKSLGLAVEDLAAAELTYRKALATGLGTWVEWGGERH